jgi:hypothetical protein
MTTKKTLAGVPGVLNSPAHGGKATQDPHHGEQAGLEFHPVMEVDDTVDYKTLRQKVVTDIRSFAQGFQGSWNWRFGWGKNCHTFQERLKKATGLHHQKGKSWLKRPDTAGTLQEAEAEQKRQKDEEAENSIPGPVYRLKEDLKAGSMPGGDDIDIPAGGKIKVTNPANFPDGGYGIGDVEIRWNKRDCYAFPDYILNKGEKVS